MAAERVRLELDDTSWIDVHRGWLDPVTSAELYEALVSPDSGLRWWTNRLFRYDHYVEENRLGASWRPGTPVPHPSLPEIHRRVRHETGAPFEGPSFNWYRDGGDGQAFHRDRDLRWCEDTVIAILTLGATRPWLVRPKANRHSVDETRYKGTTHDLHPAAGDLLVMGGRCQADWEHAVPPIREPVDGRVSVQWRWTSKRGRPEIGASYRAPRHYSRR